MTKPVRIQLRRTKGWRMPPNTVSVARPGFWGNPYRVELDEVRHTGEWDEDGNDIWTAGPWLCRMPGPHLAGIWFADKAEATERAVALFRLRIERLGAGRHWREHLRELRGKNLACWCPLDAPCHADVLLELANPTAANGLTADEERELRKSRPDDLWAAIWPSGVPRNISADARVLASAAAKVFRNALRARADGASHE